MITKADELARLIVLEMDNEIKQYDDIINILKDPKSVLGDEVSVNQDIVLMEAKKGIFKNVKNLVLKLSLQLENVDNEAILTLEEKAIFYQLVRIVLFIRRIFKPILYIYDKTIQLVGFFKDRKKTTL